VARLAGPRRAAVSVFSIARVHGTAFGFPSPGLLPTRREWQEQRDLVANAVKALKKRGFEADGEVVGTRKAAARICEQATRLECDVIVMAADPPRNRVVADFLWSQEPYRVRRRSKLPVYLVEEPAAGRPR
jgi:nucleotide-binding universal stress UspA family protein